MKKIKKAFKILIVFFSIVISILAISGVGFYFYVTNSSNLDKSKLNTINTNSIEIYDINNNPIKPKNENYISILKLKKHTKDAFISAEDKRFYNHNGIDFIRVGGAIISNLKSRSFSEGASTISQQLIKNTQLSNEKTITRKLKEMKMTKQLEKDYSKDEILEFYLNNIYFGNGQYGIENASNYYFNKSSENLSLGESAILAGTINAPSFYNIETNFENANKRKNLILKLMKNYGKITETQYNNAILEDIKLNIKKINTSNFLYNEIIDETIKILNINEKKLKNNKYKIYTYIDLDLQEKINEIVKNNYSNLSSNPNIASIITDNETNGITAIIGNKSTFERKRQPGSVIKPILVYAPAFESNKISPSTKIIDEKINISGYSPENADKKYHGQISVRTALKNSYNIPAVKILNEIGITNAQNFAKKLGITFSNADNNLAIALGGFTDGVKLKNLCDAYTCFANLGNYKESTYIRRIIKNKKNIYSNKSVSNSVMSESTAYLITDILKDTCISGTAKRLKNFDFDIASKTGTVGLSNSKYNSDSYNISYTSKHTILSYFGGTKMPENINGSTYPTLLTKDILSIIYLKNKPQNFTIPESIVKKNISKNDYNKNILTIANNKEEFITEIFSKSNLPINSNEQNFNIKVYNFYNKKPIISFELQPEFSYKIIRKKENAEEVISSANQYKKFVNFEDKNAKSNEIYEYYVVFYDKTTKNMYFSNKIKLKIF